MKKIQKTISINATAQKVWDVLVVDELNRQWYAEFMPGSHATTDWQQGSKALFTDGDGNGIVGNIDVAEP